MNDDFFQILSEISRKRPLDKEVWNNAEKLRQAGVMAEEQDIRDVVSFIGVDSLFGGQGHRYQLPKYFYNVISQLLEGNKSNVVVDPNAGVGALAEFARRCTSSSECICFDEYSKNDEVIKASKILFPELKWSYGYSTKLIQELEHEIDLAISFLPLGVRYKPSTEIIINGNKLITSDQGQFILTCTVDKLSKGGIGLFIVPDNFFTNYNSIFKKFDQFDFNLQAAFSLPENFLEGLTTVRTSLILVSKVKSDKTFVAQLSENEDSNKEIVKNFRAKNSSNIIELGSFVQTNTFRGIRPLLSEEYFKNKLLGLKCLPKKIRDLSIAITVGDSRKDFKFTEKSNSIYIPKIGRGDVVCSIGELNIKVQNYIQVVLDKDKANSLFLSNFLNSEIGIEIRLSNYSNGVISVLTKNNLQLMDVYIPDLSIQREILQVNNKLNEEANNLYSLQNYITELKRKVWTNQSSLKDISDKIDDYSLKFSSSVKEQSSVSLEEWFDTIPFPLASILRTWQASESSDFKSKYLHLLHFFEATAEFLSIIYISAFRQDPIIFEKHRQKIYSITKKYKLSFTRSTFGTWRVVYEYFSKQTRSLLSELDNSKNNNDDREPTVARLFADNSFKLPRLISSKPICSILEKANIIRNQTSGHGGFIDQNEAKLLNDQLIELVERLREEMADLWDEITLTKGLMTKLKGGVFENEIALLKGSNSEFLKESKKMSMPLDSEFLYLIFQNQTSGLKMVPLIQISSSPKSANNACYFYSALNKNGAKFISYHHAPDNFLQDESLETSVLINSFCTE